ncbi:MULTISPECIES: heavy metal sensor histidine kinase [Comamonas]|jgi:two-component system heavy metal sensor histidine kinase CusS|uniref:heavy metal sensor histidine kinase n=1 Tax=Comamonas TaxID=283 RepID=UPI0012C61BE7|nr:MULTISPECIES: heavy metal sensor histidine kinase [Comamonas]MDR3066791.1 heavy metal sensor histidine kinase [Comamonas sp.]MEB5963272.1 heavy metal sensor histidine kinase [Comamonas testosteroni]MPS94391.1 heavy metal sensor histidine kinase [Comamonas sp.]
MTADSRTPNLSRRLSRSLALQTMLGLGLVCVAVYWGSWLALAQRQQESLEQKQVTVTHLLQQARANRSASNMQHMLSDFLTGHEDMSIRVSHADGTLLFEKLNQPLDDVHSARRNFGVELPTQADPSERQLVQVLLVLDRRPDDALLRQLAWILGLAAVSGALLVSLFSAWLVRRGLAPLHSLVEQTRQLGAKDLSRDWQTRLDDSNQPQELRPLIAQFNALLERLAVAYRQMEAFNADVAHELNTPLTTLISSCELALRKPREARELRDILASNLEDLQRMAGIVADMLFLSHADRGESAHRIQVASLASLAAEVVEYHEAALQEADLQVKVQGDARAQVDARLLRRALSNLLGNATRYATPGSCIEIQISTPQAGQVTLAVQNLGLAIAPEHLPRLFDRFYRSDAARSQADRNHGLGLAIVAAIARMHGGQAFARSEQPVTTIGLSLPTDPSAQAPASGGHQA